MRGYAPTEVPAGGPTRPAELVADALALHEALGGGPDAVLIGHDWGAAVAYGAAPAAPERWRRVVALAVPPTAVYVRFAFAYEQVKRSFYFWFLQMDVAERAIAADDLRFLDGSGPTGRPGTAPPRTSPAPRTACASRPTCAPRSATTAASSPGLLRLAGAAAEVAALWGGPTPQPALYLHGRPTAAWRWTTTCWRRCRPHSGRAPRRRSCRGAGHFLLVERPDEVNRLILAFLAA